VIDSDRQTPRYADTLVHASVPIVSNERIAFDTYRLRFHCAEMATRFVPGQFLMVRIDGCQDPLLGRPFALFDTVLDAEERPIGIDVVYLVKGKLTSRLAKLERGAVLGVWGPLGNGFAPVAARRLIMAAGGIGQTPFLALGRESLGRRAYGTPARPILDVPDVILLYGARSADRLAGVDAFRDAGIDGRIATEDGSAGHRGRVTELLEACLAESASARGGVQVVACGPDPMLEAVSRLTREARVACRVSLETPMACGIGICFSCVARVRDGEGWDYRRTCVEGPVFAADSIVWSVKPGGRNDRA